MASTEKNNFFFNDTATTEIYTLSLHDALPIYFTSDFAKNDKLISQALGSNFKTRVIRCPGGQISWQKTEPLDDYLISKDRKSTRLNSSHANISYAVFCLKKNIFDSSRMHSATL